MVLKCVFDTYVVVAIQRVSLFVELLCVSRNIKLSKAFGDNVRLGSDAGGSAKIDDADTTNNSTH